MRNLRAGNCLKDCIYVDLMTVMKTFVLVAAVIISLEWEGEGQQEVKHYVLSITGLVMAKPYLQMTEMS